MAYFEKFPKIVYTQDNYKTGQIVPDILRRTKFISELTENFAFFDEYDVKDGETPEIVADLFYNDPQLHWIILQTNEIIDPRFDWPLSTYDLRQFAEGKYANINATHHYEDNSGNRVTANLVLKSGAQFGSIAVNDVLVNNTNVGVGVVTAKANTSHISVLTTSGGFISGDQVKLASNANVVANITSIIVTSGTPITNLNYESTENETKRRIKILKPEIIAEVIVDFESTITR